MILQHQKNGKFPETLSVVLQTSPAKFDTSWCSHFYGPIVNQELELVAGKAQEVHEPRDK